MEFNRGNVTHGAILVGKVQTLTSQFTTTPYNTVPPAPALEWDVLPASTDGYVLTCSAAANEGVAWAAPATHGTVTSVSLTGDGTVLATGPGTAVTASGTLTAALATHAANVILAGPATGAAAAPTFRALVAADLPAGTGSGSVTSVTLTGDGTVLATGPSTAVTASGTLTAALATQMPMSLWSAPRPVPPRHPHSGHWLAPTCQQVAQARAP